MSDESIKPSATFDNSLTPSLNYIGTKTRVKFEGQCLKQDKVTVTPGKTVIVEMMIIQHEKIICLAQLN